jgi:uncharacterized repeat protein (TIGR03806 family)
MNRSRFVISVLAALALLTAAALWSSQGPTVAADGAKEPEKPFGIDKRLPLTTSTVVGSPDPPPPYRVKKVYPDLKIRYPIAIKQQPDSDRYLFIDEKTPYSPTRLLRMKADQADSNFEVLLDMKGVAYEIAFHPDFKKNGYMYLGHNDPTPPDGHKTRITRYTIDPKPPYKFDPKSEKIIIEWASDGHNGGAMAFGIDGMLYVTSGDGTSDSDRNIVGQDMSKLLSKVLRIDVDHPDKDRAYSVPKDNPFVEMKDARPETWAYGFRNPWRITVDKKTGHVWVAQNGQDLWEQAYLVRKGENYGWSVTEGSHEFYPNRKTGPTPIVKPTVEHHHSEARSLTGGIVYYGEKYPDLRGAYIYGDYSTGKIWGVKHDGTKIIWHKLLADSRLAITGFAADVQGELLICDHHTPEQGGGFYTLEPTPKDLPPSTFPKKLSDSGLFKSVKGHVMQPALIPYSVNAQLWSDGAYKERWIALPGADSKMEFSHKGGWNCPDKTVLVKSFALEMEEGNPASRRWIETRFLTNQQGEWFGYSYLWNDEQTEGTLVEAGGRDREYTIKVAKSKEHPDGERRQKWHYPSRAECMVCHSRAANWVLGLSEVQMNKVHDYGGVKDNQLRTLDHIGVLSVPWKEKEKFRALADPSDPKEELSARARSYLHANCAHCHVEAGGGNALMELEISTKVEKMNVLGVKPQHHTFDLPDAKLVAPGHPESSVLLHRLSNRERGHMPPLATNVVDREAVQMLTEWIKQLPTK